MYMNVWIYYSPLVNVALACIGAIATWKIIIAIIKSIPFVG